MIFAGEEPDCPAPPCLPLAAFVQAVADDQRVVGLGTTWHRRQFGGQADFYTASHLVAYDADDVALYCSEASWDEPKNLAYVDNFMARIRTLAKLSSR